MSRKKTHEEYVVEVAEKNPNVEVIGEYIGARTPILHKCKICGYKWDASPTNILRDRKCPKCKYVKLSKHKTKTTETFRRELYNKTQNIEIISDYINGKTDIECVCKSCGYRWNQKPNNLLQSPSCPICSGYIIGPAPEYKNSIWASKYKYLAEYYGISEKIMKETRSGSKNKINVVCPNCGYIKKISPSNLFYFGLGCNKCSDGISYPEKFMTSVLDQLQINYQLQYSPSWAEGKRYDFYLLDYNCIIETHGEQHYEEHTRGRSLQEE